MIPVADTGGAVSQIKLPRSNGQADTFVRVKAPFDSAEKLAEYGGTYYSEEFDKTYEISRKGNGFIVHITDTFQAPLTPAYEDVFTTAEVRSISYSPATRRERSPASYSIPPWASERLRVSCSSEGHRAGF